MSKFNHSISQLVSTNYCEAKMVNDVKKKSGALRGADVQPVAWVDKRAKQGTEAHLAIERTRFSSATRAANTPIQMAASKERGSASISFKVPLVLISLVIAMAAICLSF